MGHKHRVRHKIYGHLHASLLLLLLFCYIKWILFKTKNCSIAIPLMPSNGKCNAISNLNINEKKPLFDTKQYPKAMMAIPLFGWCPNVYFIIIY